MNWKITNLEIQKHGESYTDIVIKAHWQVELGEVRYYDVCTLPAPEGDFVPLEDLTQQQVLDWVWANGVSKFKAEQKVLAKIEKLANPPIYSQQFDEEAITVTPSDALEPQYQEVVQEPVTEDVTEDDTEEVTEDITEDVATVEDTTELEAQLEEAEAVIADAEEKLQAPE